MINEMFILINYQVFYSDKRRNQLRTVISVCFSIDVAKRSSAYAYMYIYTNDVLSHVRR